ncbi:SAM domain (Sterile alpha motif) domain containing protein, variant 2 [Balamuthia mandrillaris]
MQAPVEIRTEATRLNSQAIKTEVEQKIHEVKTEIHEVKTEIQEVKMEIRAESDEHLRNEATALLSSLMQRRVKLHALLNTLTERLQEHYGPHQTAGTVKLMTSDVPSPLRSVTAHEFRVGMEKVSEKVSELAEQFSRLAPTAHTERSLPTTFAERYMRLHKAYVDKAWFSVAAKQPPGLFTPSGCPAAGASESRTVQPYWAKKLKKIPQNLPIVLEDTHKKVSFGNRKPDVVGYVAEKPRTIFNIALIGDVKPRRAVNQEAFDNAEKGHLESFMEELLIDYQPYRNLINGFLTDGCLIQFFRLNRQGDRDLIWEEGPVLYLHDEGGKWLLGLLSDKAAHNLPADIIIDNKPVIMNQLLGIGGSSVVYSGEFNGLEVVVKRFISSSYISHLITEKNYLRQLKELAPWVPLLVASSKKHLVLLLRPIGMKFVSRINQVNLVNYYLSTKVKILSIANKHYRHHWLWLMQMIFVN